MNMVVRAAVLDRIAAIDGQIALGGCLA